MKRYYPLLVLIVFISGMIIFVMKGKGSAASARIGLKSSPNSQSSTAPTQPVSPGTSPSASSAAPGLSDGTHTGQTVSTDYGDIQVALVVANGKITAVNVLKRPGGSSQSDDINKQALPMLKSEVLTAQSANIDAVSGASFTSDGFIRSLQTALNS